MSQRLNPRLGAVTPPPVAQTQAWIRGRQFAADKPLLDLAQAVPSYAPAHALRRHVAAVASASATSVYTEILGMPALRESLARHLGRGYDADVDASNIAITSGCNQAFCVAISALAGPGDEVLLTLPCYFNHEMWLEMQGITPVYIDFDAAHPNRLRVDAVRDAITPRTRALILVSPCNPTGAEYASADIEAIHDLLAARGVTLVIDETYKDFRTAQAPPHGLMSKGAHARAGLVQLFSFSKSYSMTGYRVGALACNSELIAGIEKILDCVAICPPRISQEAACFALANLDDWRDEKRLLMGERVQALRRALERPHLDYRLVECGAYFAYLRHPFGETPALEVARRLAERENILCLPGSFFGPGQDAYLRLAFANVESRHFDALVDRLLASQKWA